MDREIKFRAWDALEEKMFGEGMSSQEFWSYVHPSSCDVFVMQYTGLKDANGIRIYEGDIVEATYLGEINKPPLLEVVWDNYALSFMFVRSNDCYSWRIDLKHIKIIGNIYENPELLKEI